MKKPFGLFALFLILTLSFWSCQNDQAPIAPESYPTSSTLNKSDFRVYLLLEVVDGLGGGLTYDLNIHKLTKKWKEDEVTWNSRLKDITWNNPGGDFAFTPVVKYPVENNKSLKIDITELFSGGVPQNGFIIKVANASLLPVGRRIKFYSKEGINPPKIVIVFGNGNDKRVTFPVTADAEILATDKFQNMNFGPKSALYAGLPDSGGEVRSVLKFDIPNDIIPPTEACTHTKAYWKTHAKGKKKDLTWDLLEPDGKNTEFFKSQKSYYKVLWSPPRRGNVYYLLAYEYIAAQLNQLNGTESSEINDAFNTATKLFEEYSPKKIERLRRNNDLRKQFLELAKELRNYNTGEIGPGHCDDYKWHKKEKEWKKWWKKKWGKKP